MPSQKVLRDYAMLPALPFTRVDGNIMRRVAACGLPVWTIGEEITIDRNRLPGRVIVDRQTIHVQDMAAEAKTEFPGSMAID